MSSLSEDEETILQELELILMTVKQIDSAILESISVLENPAPDNADYNQLVRRNTESIKQIISLLKEI